MVKVLKVIVIRRDKGVITGPERREFNVADMWESYGVKPTYLYPSQGRVFNDLLQKQKAEVIPLMINSIFDLKSIRLVLKYIKQNDFQIIHTQGGIITDLIYSLIGWLNNIRVIVTRPVLIDDYVHYPYWKIRLYKILDEYITLKLISRLVVINSIGYKYYRDKIAAEKVLKIYNGVSEHNGISSIQDEKQIKSVAMVGHMSPFKRWDIFIEVANCLTEANPELRFIMVGDGPERKNITNLISKYGLNDKFTHIPYTSDVRSILSKVDLFLFTSSREGLSVAILEAMSVGLPVVCTDAGAANEQIEQGISGYVVDKEDVESLSKYAAIVLNNSKLRFKMGLASKARCNEKFSQNRMVEEYSNLYKLF